MRQNTADDKDNDTQGRDHETTVRVHMPRDDSAVKAGNACPKAHTANAGALPGQKVLPKNAVSFQMESKSGPCGPDVHGLADDADFSHRVPIRSAPHGDRLALRLSGAGHSRSSHLGSLPC